MRLKIQVVFDWLRKISWIRIAEGVAGRLHALPNCHAQSHRGVFPNSNGRYLRICHFGDVWGWAYVDNSWAERIRLQIQSKRAGNHSTRNLLAPMKVLQWLLEEREQLRKRINKEAAKKGKNCKIPMESTYVLQKWLLENFSNPYPSHTKKLEMARQSKLSVGQVNNWFINARERVVKRFYKKETLKMMKSERSGVWS